MAKRTDIKKILIIGSGPIVIGQAAEFDYAGTQACLALKEEGYEVILANSNPAQLHRVAVHGIAVVLAGDIGADALHIPDGLVHTPVAVLQLVGAAARGQRRQLVAKADPEHGNLPQQLSDLFDLVHVFRRVAGSVGEHDAVRIRRQNFLRGGGRR